ncbi:PaREP1 family protein [Acidianus hospitalis W1]|uniref:PaREP1 family protein n=2 Tax=Acidianus hospitalis TaxID=563177 RepID=F4B578_ACIHW|nr:PaREP1 family protein [Acidianus hospitalis W1]
MMQILKTSADVYLEEADELLDRGDTLQASEKYYKAAEEAIKILSGILLEDDIISEVRNKDWNTEIINKAVFKLSSILGKWIIESWGSAIALITVNLDAQQIKKYREGIVRLVQVADERFNRKIIERS